MQLFHLVSEEVEHQGDKEGVEVWKVHKVKQAAALVINSTNAEVLSGPTLRCWSGLSCSASLTSGSLVVRLSLHSPSTAALESWVLLLCLGRLRKKSTAFLIR